MTIITRNDIAEHLQSRIAWQRRVADYFGRNGRRIPESVRQGIIENRAQTYRMADNLEINLDEYERRTK